MEGQGIEKKSRERKRRDKNGTRKEKIGKSIMKFFLNKRVDRGRKYRQTGR